MKNILTIKLILAITLVFISLSIQASDLNQFSLPIKDTGKVLDFDRSAAVASKEYWFKVSGAQLNKGVALNNTSPRILMLVSQSRDSNSQDQASSAQPVTQLDVSQMKLLSEQGAVVLSKGVSEAQLAQTGFFSRSAAVFTDKNAPDQGPLKLQTDQPLSPQENFLIMVREPDSEYILNLETDSQSVNAQRDILARVSVTLPNTLKSGPRALRPVNFTGILIGVDGSRVKLKSEYKNGNLVFMRPNLSTIISPIEGLYELLVEANGSHKGKVFQRKAKFAFALSKATARIESNILPETEINGAHVSIMVNEYSRFEVRAVLYGTDASGALVPVMETHVAQSLNPGLATLPLMFNPDIIANAGVKKPFKIANIRLYDQQQMAMLEEQNPLAVNPPKIVPKFRP
ncbi:DUF4785 domain-containing protein [Aliiglaciecola sp. LCG003]|uniref:DUF4785 domain-containing protein n=1 Tax=Aliiglaciecola sp. LCG003 TaxID=3053655 RepID=UPI002572EEFD|nr:DUF4785 domain-containing protein [Aliiglaciecola sp. LCG003]WJG10118.1 hypothetical protein QR722_03500 [Aliiglaciecola sp. LCG003]